MSWFTPKRANRLHRHDLRVLDSKLRTRIRSQRQARLAMLSGGVLLLAGLLGWGAWLGVRQGAREVFTENPAYALRDIAIESTGEALKPERVQAYLKLQTGQNLLTLNLAQMRHDLELWPMVEQAEVTRELPSRLRIRITERIAVANVSSVENDKRFQVDRHGVVMDLLSYVRVTEDYHNRLSALPEIIGANMSDLKVGRSTTSRNILKAVALIEKMGRPEFDFMEIQTIDVSRNGILVVNLLDHAVIRIGAADSFPDMDRQLRRLARILADARRDPERAAKHLQSVDLTVRNDIPVVWTSNP